MEQVFSYIIGLGAAVMMPIIFTILGVCIGIKFSKALKSGLLVGVGFVGLSVITSLLTSTLGPALSKVVEIYGLQLKVFDMGWPAAASVAYNTSVGAFIIPHEGADLHESDIKEYCKGKIAHYKIPKYVLFVEGFPLTGSGKIQKFKLKDIGLQMLAEQGVEVV